MMKEKRKGMLQRGIMVAVSALTVVASAGTVMAYQPTQSSDESFEEFISDGSIYDFGFEDMDDIATAAIDFSQGDSIFVDSDGNQIVYQEESSDTYALCTHSMVQLFIPIQKILLVDALLKYINVKDVKNVDIVLMPSMIILLHMQNALIN